MFGRRMIIGVCASILLFSCSKEAPPYTPEEIAEEFRIEIASPQDGMVYSNEIELPISIELSAPYSFHGYLVLLFDPEEGSILWSASEHTHSNVVQVEEFFLPDGFSGTMELHVEGYVDHEGIEVRDKITFMLE